MTDHPRFTFCIPNLNKIDFLPACIESMLAQDCDDWCCVFVDGFSTDGSWEYMQQFADDPRFRLMRGLRNGMYADWNYCLAQVETEYFYILTSDDTCEPGLVSTTVNALDHFPNVDACHFQFDYINQIGEVTHGYECVLQSQFPFYSNVYQYAHLRAGTTEVALHFIYRTLYITIHSLVFRQRLIEKIGYFSTEYGSVGDYDWSMRLGLHTDILYIPDNLASWRVYEGQATQKDSESALARLLEIARKNSKLLPEITKKNLISQLLSDTMAARYKNAVRSQGLGNKLAQLANAVRSHPEFLLLYAHRKAVGTFDEDGGTPRFSKKVAAKKIISEGSLAWPPKSAQIHTLADRAPAISNFR